MIRPIKTTCLKLSLCKLSYKQTLLNVNTRPLTLIPTKLNLGFHQRRD